MIGARSGHATLSRCTCGSAAATARSYAPLATVAGVASSPTRPVWLPATASWVAGATTPITSISRPACSR